jgi:hypothetical protein
MARFLCAAVTSSGRPPSSSAWTSNGMSSSAKARARAWMSSSAADRPYMRGWPLSAWFRLGIRPWIRLGVPARFPLALC